MLVQINGQFFNKQDQIDAEQKLGQVCQVRYPILKKLLLNVLYCERLDSFKTKNRKLATLIAKQSDSYKSSTYSTPAKLTNSNLDYITVLLIKNENIKKHLAAISESLADKITENLDIRKRENFHES